MSKIKFSKEEQAKALINYIDGDWADETMYLVLNKETKELEVWEDRSFREKYIEITDVFDPKYNVYFADGDVEAVIENIGLSDFQIKLEEEEKMEKTIKFEMVTGINEGYYHKNQNKNGVQIVGEVWQKIALEVFKERGIYISSVINGSKTVYNKEWGCPEGGEDTVTITSTANPEFVQNLEQWKEAVIQIAKKIKKELKQSTMTVEFKEISDFIYLK
ncbi:MULTISPECIES: hypothetical protein [Clostridium]|uniref:Uncharacterized protein n=1 Tax=Clostridium sporogenes TaxID=1509 RepID=A0AAE6LWM7_CLOSG|nr:MULTISPECIES: hypothetical protein [Clostridium]APQ78561.1 hypothetical protein RSJ10_3678 [Clostridium botulinum]MBN3356037.1 hypothetical protein [Clostridium botulinum]QDY34622.1 hypothetical protein CGS26_20195 [Clostridium sporogenes]